MGGGDEGRSNYSILGCVQLCGVSLPPLSFLISFIGLYWELSVSQHEGRVDRKIDKAHTHVWTCYTHFTTRCLSAAHMQRQRERNNNGWWNLRLFWWFWGSFCSLLPSGYCVSIVRFLASHCSPSKINGDGSRYKCSWRQLSFQTKQNCQKLLLIIEEEVFPLKTKLPSNLPLSILKPHNLHLIWPRLVGWQRQTDAQMEAATCFLHRRLPSLLCFRLAEYRKFFR